MIKDYITRETGSIKEVLLGVGIAFSIATSLRPEGVPVGVGEVLLVLWFVLTLFAQKKSYIISNIYLVTVGIIAVSSILLLLGSVNSYINGTRGVSVRSALAYVFSWGLLWLLVRQSNLDVRRVCSWLIGGFFLSVVIAMCVGPLHANNHINVLWTDQVATRYWENLSDNRNQFALLVLTIPFISLVLSSGSKKYYWYRAPIVLIAIVLAVLTRSDAICVGWVVGGVVTVVFASKRRKGKVGSECQDLFLGLVLIICAASIIGYKIWPLNMISESEDAQIMMPKSGVVVTDSADVSQVKSRIALLKHGIDAIWLSSMVGYGPGSFSGDNGPFEGREAHNTLIDWATQAGVLGGLTLLGYWLWILRYVIKYGEAVLIGLIVALGVFACFHYTLRQPLFWLMPALVLLYIDQVRARMNGKLVEG